MPTTLESVGRLSPKLPYLSATLITCGSIICPRIVCGPVVCGQMVCAGIFCGPIVSGSLVEGSTDWRQTTQAHSICTSLRMDPRQQCSLPAVTCTTERPVKFTPHLLTLTKRKLKVKFCTLFFLLLHKRSHLPRLPSLIIFS
jgi:hypothetical protein